MSPKPFLGILLAIAASAALPLRSAEAATITVTTTVDELNADGDCSLREGVRAATCTNSTISGNQAADTAGGIYTFRGTIAAKQNCTVR